MRDNSTAKLNISLRIAAVMLVLVLLSAAMTSGLYARYTTTAYGEDSARAAKFEVSVDTAMAQMTDFSFSPDMPFASYSFKVSGNSEVSIKYDVILELPAESVMPAGVTITIDGTHAVVSGNTYTFSNDSWVSAAGSYDREHTMTIDITSFEQNSTLNGIVVKVIAGQID